VVFAGEEQDAFLAKDEDLSRFSNQIEQWQRGEMSSNETFELGKTPFVLQKIGADNLPVIMTQKVMEKVTGGKHDVGLTEIKNLPQHLADPVMVFRSATQKNALVVLTEMVDKNGDSVVCALHLNKTEKHINVNRIASVYGKENIDSFVRKQAKAGNLLYMDKKKCQQWSRSRGLQLPKLADTITDNNNILQKSDIVNSYYMLENDKDTENESRQQSTSRGLQLPKLVQSIADNSSVSQGAATVNDDVVFAGEETGNGGINYAHGFGGLTQYTEKEKKNWKNSKTILVYSNLEQFKEFVNRVLGNVDIEKKMYFGKIPENVASRILHDTGIDVSDLNVSLKGYEIRKILLNSHGDKRAENLRGQEPVNVNDLLNIPSIITQPDRISLTEKQYEGKPALLFEKNINGKNYVLTYVSRKHHDLAIQTMYKNRSLSSAENANAFSFTSETTAGTASTDSVSQGETSVNSYSMQTQENNAFDRILRMSGGNKEKRITFDDLLEA